VEIKGKQETLNLIIRYDKATGLPLYDEQYNVLEIIKTYLALPYTIAEYGCGKKCSIIIRKLIEIGIPLYAIKRGMIMERDMSESALTEPDFKKRPHALIINNPLYHPKDFYQDILLRMLEEKSVSVSIHKNQIHAGEYVLSHNKELQFIEARSHVFPIITFWDEQAGQAQELILDPTIDPNRLLEVETIREYLHDYEALIFTAPIAGHYRLELKYTTRLQEVDLAKIADLQTLPHLGTKDYATVIRQFTGAPKNSIGDPMCWTYANNIPEKNKAAFEEQQHLTGRGDLLIDWFEDMLTARKRGEGKVVELREYLEQHIKMHSLLTIVENDADIAEAELAPLAEAESIIAYYRALLQLVNWSRRNNALNEMMFRDIHLSKVQGISKRLRNRIEKLARMSCDDENRIDARALNSRFVAATLETISQMNEAGLKVCIDKVGNIHGLLLTEDQHHEAIENPAYLRSLIRQSICHCSHIDTVKDAGRYDGRLGVLSGIETAHILYDLHKYFDIPYPHLDSQRTLIVSSYVGEEMTFTGQGVSMPGSAAVAGQQSPELIYGMKNDADETYRDELVDMLQALQKAQQTQKIILLNDFSSTVNAESLLEACFDPQLFFTPHTYERHIEQGPILDSHKVPLVIVDTIMGIHQEDFVFEGENAEELALNFNLHLRTQLATDHFKRLRVTVGVMEGYPASLERDEVGFALRCHLKGEKNHAGTTLLADRRDPGVAAARLAHFFKTFISQHNTQYSTRLTPVIGNIELLPGTNRNVIPGNMALTMGISNGSLFTEQQEELTNQLHAWIIHHLYPKVSNGGEGILSHSIEELDFMSHYNHMRLSIDIRSPDQALTHQYLEEAATYAEKQVAQKQVVLSRKVHQVLQPFPLHASGQVLQIERSFGGSHNANEAQLDSDLLRGSLLQLEVTNRFLSRVSENGNLYQQVKSLYLTSGNRRYPILYQEPYTIPVISQEVYWEILIR